MKVYSLFLYLSDTSANTCFLQPICNSQTLESMRIARLDHGRLYGELQEDESEVIMAHCVFTLKPDTLLKGVPRSRQKLQLCQRCPCISELSGETTRPVCLWNISYSNSSSYHSACERTSTIPRSRQKLQLCQRCPCISSTRQSTDAPDFRSFIGSGFVLTEISVGSTWNLFIFIILKRFWIKVSINWFIRLLNQTHCSLAQRTCLVMASRGS